MHALKFGTIAYLPFVGVALSFIPSGPGHAQEPRTFVIAAAAGYGVEDCLGEASECGKVVADAWCEAHGRGAALKFGRSGDDANRPYFITCGD